MFDKPYLYFNIIAESPQEEPSQIQITAFFKEDQKKMTVKETTFEQPDGAGANPEMSFK